MRSLFLPSVLRGIDELDLDESARAVFKNFISRVVLTDERIAFACHLLDRNAPRAEIRERLIAAFRVSRRQAYRIIAEALNTR